ncbi:MAG: RNA polymerase sigma factor [Clostridia bacterium]|nr:RNA polymerase sigma factor [Clostridia bacterium]
MEDKRIIELLWQRDESGLEATRQKYGRLCYSVAYNILGDSRDSEEAVNDTYLGVWDSIPPHRPDVLSSFLMRITRNISLKIWRYKYAEKRACNIAASLDELGECIPNAENVEKALEAKELSVYIDRFLRELKESDRIVFLRRYWFCDSIADIAKRFDASEGKIKMQLCRTRQRLQKYLNEEGICI